MDELENKLGAILNNPEMMGKIMQLAQSLNGSQPEESSSPTEQTPPPIDLSMIQKLSGAVNHGSIDANQRSLLSALAPYVSSRRIRKLERAMRAAKMAGMAGIFLNSPGR